MEYYVAGGWGSLTVNDIGDVGLWRALAREADAPPTLLGVMSATDHDVWALGHGPPFNLSFAPTNPAHVFLHIPLTFDSRKCMTFFFFAGQEVPGAAVASCMCHFLCTR